MIEKRRSVRVDEKHCESSDCSPIVCSLQTQNEFVLQPDRVKRDIVSFV